jgi:hypothetical protein
MSKQDPKPVQKISVKIWRPIIDKLDAKIEASCLRRDAYLAKLLESELAELDREVCLPNSQAAHDHIFEELDKLDRKLVSLALPPALAERLKEICARKRIVRDAFFNRLFLLLAASPKAIDGLFFSSWAVNWRDEVWRDYKSDGPFFQDGFYPLESRVNPFWAMRCALQLVETDSGKVDCTTDPTTGIEGKVTRDLCGEVVPVESLYTKVLNKKVGNDSLIGLSCHMPDHLVPGHTEERAHQAKLDELFAALGDLK